MSHRIVAMEAAPNGPGTGVAHGTFGEVLQGSLRNDSEHFLITLPIQKYSRAVFTPSASVEVTVTPEHKHKSRRFARALLDRCGVRFGGHLAIDSDLPEGKGMASSSADLVAAARAIEAAIGRPVPDDPILSVLRTIEPSDGVMYPEFVTFFHRKVELRARLGFPSRLKVVAVDEGGQVDTIEYNRRNRLFTDEECGEYARLLHAAEAAIVHDDLAELGRVTTRSAILNQRRNPKRHLDQMIDIGRQHRALGVVVAHSGPCAGLLFPDDAAHRDQIERARAELAAMAGDAFVVISLDRGAAMSAATAA